MADVEVRESGTAVSVAAGDRIVIRLAENPTTGYQWTISSVPDPLELLSSEFVAPERLQPGAAGERLVVLRARSAGHSEVALKLARAWEQREPLAQWHVGVTVR